MSPDVAWVVDLVSHSTLVLGSETGFPCLAIVFFFAVVMVSKMTTVFNDMSVQAMLGSTLGFEGMIPLFMVCKTFRTSSWRRLLNIAFNRSLTSTLTHLLWAPEEKLGSGNFGTVIKVRSTEDGCSYAAKGMKKQLQKVKRSRTVTCHTEGAIMTELGPHSNLIRLHGIQEHGGWTILILGRRAKV